MPKTKIHYCDTDWIHDKIREKRYKFELNLQNKDIAREKKCQVKIYDFVSISIRGYKSVII